jgi:hypothetical protein
MNPRRIPDGSSVRKATKAAHVSRTCRNYQEREGIRYLGVNEGDLVARSTNANTASKSRSLRKYTSTYQVHTTHMF